MSDYTYEYIPDKKMYAAVRGACNYIRETGWYNKAISYYAKKYDVDEDELKGYVNRRTHAKKRESGYKMKTFTVKIYCASEAEPEWVLMRSFTQKAKSKENVEKRCSEWCFNEKRRADYGGVYAPYFTYEVEEEQ